MASATADTNIYVSAFQFGGVPRNFLDGASSGDFRTDISNAILEETLGVLRRKFQWSSEALMQAEQDIRSYAELVTPTQALQVIESNPADNRILECALAAKSDYIVTGDTRHLLPMRRYGGIRIVKVADFLTQLG